MHDRSDPRDPVPGSPDSRSDESGRTRETDDGADSVADAASAPDGVIVFWRPGCGFCASLMYQLEATELPLYEVNIWEDAAAAATVRRIANGNETVPCVVVGEVAMVNPSLGQVMAAVNEHAPHLLSSPSG